MGKRCPYSSDSSPAGQTVSAAMDVIGWVRFRAQTIRSAGGVCLRDPSSCVASSSRRLAALCSWTLAKCPCSPLMCRLTTYNSRLGSACRTRHRSGRCDLILVFRSTHLPEINSGRYTSASDSFSNMRRLLFWAVMSGVGILLLAIVGLGLYTRTEHFHTLARAWLLAALQSSINGEVTLERLSG